MADPDSRPDLSKDTVGAVQVRLPDKLDTAAAAGIHGDLLKNSRRDLNLDFGSVTMLGALCLQVLLNARHHWGEQGHKITVSNVMPPVEKTLADFGLTTISLATGEVT